MLDLETKISETRANTDRLRRDLVSEALSEYTKALRLGGANLPGNVETATVRARALIKERLFSRRWLALVSGEASIEEASFGRVALAFESVTLPLQVPPPPIMEGPKMLAVATWACVGAALGMLLLTPLARIGLDMRDLGLVLGGPLGAFLCVLVYSRLAKVPMLRVLVCRVMGLSKSGPSYDLKGHELVVRGAIDQWLQGAIALLVVVCSDRRLFAEGDIATEKVLGRLSKKIYALHHASEQGLRVVADELILEARNLGFEGLEGVPSFMTGRREARAEMPWKEALASHYQVFGHIEEGDSVRVERKPVILEGRVIEPGLVRKVRKKT